jgi:7-carboxy-7-deazaguanine synthase
MRINEIFKSIHGECNGHHQGRIVTFIRVSGCNLKCSYCDTPETQDHFSGRSLSIVDIIANVRSLGNKYVCVTGGEPLSNSEIDSLLYTLWNDGYHVSVETNGSIDITPTFRFVESFVIDYKMEYEDRMILQNYKNLRNTDVVKFVVKNEKELQRAINIKQSLEEADTKCIFAFSPIVSKSFDSENIANLLLNKNIHNAVLSLQIHKMLDLK